MCTKNNYKLKSKKIYLIRHGQTDFNLRGIVQGSGVDASLNATGKAQSAAFYSSYKQVPFDKVYTSVLKRSIESVQQFIDDGIPHERFAGLNEINWGTREGMEITPEEDAYYHSVLRKWQMGEIDLKIEGGESPSDVLKRQQPVIDEILSREDEEIILICMHGRAMRVLLCQLLHYPLHCMDIFEHHNLGLYKLNYTGNMLTVESFNDISHLSGL